MEKTSNDLHNFSDIPSEIQQHIAAYLDVPALGFFAQSRKQILKTVLPLLRNYQAMFPLRVTAKGSSTYLTQAHQLLVCGNNVYGQLGLGDEANCATFTAVPWPEDRGKIEQLIVGGYHTVVLTADNRLWGCGDNDAGQLGLGDNAQRSTFTAMPWPDDRGQIQQIIAGGNHTVVLTQDNQLWVCGDNGYGQLGLGDNVNRSIFTAVPWPTEQGKIQQLIAGSCHTVVLTTDNRLWVCGYNGLGQLGLGNNKRRAAFTAVPWPAERGQIQQVIANGDYTLVLTKDKRLWVCGYNEYGQLGLGDTENRSIFTAVPWSVEQGRIQRVIAGAAYTVVLTQTNRLWVCGFNVHGQLGLGDNEPRLNFAAMPWPDEQGTIQQVIAGWTHTIVLTHDNRLWVCGDNKYGQLGLGDNKPRATFTPMNMKTLSPTLQELFTLNNTLNQLIKLGISLTLTPDTETSILLSQHQRDEPEGQPPLKKMRL